MTLYVPGPSGPDTQWQKFKKTSHDWGWDINNVEIKKRQSYVSN